VGDKERADEANRVSPSLRKRTDPSAFSGEAATRAFGERDLRTRRSRRMNDTITFIRNVSSRIPDLPRFGKRDEDSAALSKQNCAFWWKKMSVLSACFFGADICQDFTRGVLDTRRSIINDVSSMRIMRCSLRSHHWHE